MPMDMFDVKEIDTVGFESRWRVKKVSTESSCQTSEYALQEIDTQTTVRAEVQTQTEPPSTNPDVDMGRLADWLGKVYPGVKKELDEANNCHAFKNYRPMKSSTEANAKLQQTLQVSPPPTGDDTPLRVGALSWNCTGNTIAVACNLSHKNWCHHPGLVKFFSISKTDVFYEKAIMQLDTGACVTFLKYHPVLPFVIAGGTYSGEVTVWNTQQDQGDCIVTKINAHDEGVTQISWVYDIDAAKTLLMATSSLDGALNLWNFSLPNASVTIKETYKIKAPVLGRIRQIEQTAPQIANKICRGIICFDFSPYVPDMFVVGVEGGLVVQCSMLGCNSLIGSTEEVPVSDPVFKYYEPHEGEIQSISFSPNRKEMFLTHGTHGEIRIYVLTQEDTAQVIFLEKPLMIVSWIPFEEKLVCGCGEKGTLEIFDILKARPLKNVTKDKLQPSIFTQMSLNCKRSSTVVTGNNNGFLQLWNVPWHHFSAKI